MADTRLKSYKNKGLDVEEMRRRREDEGLQIRKSKRDEQVTKRRNIGLAEIDGDGVVPLENQQPELELRSIPDMVQAMYSADISSQHAGCLALRRALSKAGDPPIEETISTGVVPRLVEFVHSHENTRIQLEAAWSLTNIASGSSLQTRVIVEAGAVPTFIHALSRGEDDVMEQVIWGLGNIAGDSPDCRDYVIQNKALSPLLDVVKQSERVSMRRNAVWAISNLCRGKNPNPDFAKVKMCIPVFAQLLYCEDDEIVRDVCWTFSFLSDGDNYKIQHVIDAGISRRLLELLLHKNDTIVSPALRTVGNIVTGDDVQTQVIVNCGLLPCLIDICSHEKSSIRKEVFWTISNITAGNRAQIQAVIDSNVMPVVLEKLSGDEFKVKKEALWVVANATSGGTPVQIKYLVDIGCIKPVCDMLTVQDVPVSEIALDTLGSILKIGQEASKRNDGINQYATLIEEADGMDKLEFLQSHENEQLHRKAYGLIEKYFQDEEDKDNEDLMPQAQGWQFQFKTDDNAPHDGSRFS